MAILEDYDVDVPADDDFEISYEQLQEQGLDKYDVE